MKRTEKRLSPQSIPASGLDRDAAASLIAAAGDIGLVVNAAGVITDISMSDSAEPPEDSDKWVGMRFVDTVTIDDPVYYSKPWTNERTFTLSNEHLLEYSCEENNRSLWEGRIKIWQVPGAEPVQL